MVDVVGARASVRPFVRLIGWSLTPGFQHYVAVPVSVPVAVSVTVSAKTVSVPTVPYAVAGACARQ